MAEIVRINTELFGTTIC